MQESNTLSHAFFLLVTFDDRLIEIILLSLYVSGSSLLYASLIGMPLGALLAMTQFPFKKTVHIMMQSLTGLPPVLAGLIVYVLLSKQGPLGILTLLYTPTAMIIAQGLSCSRLSPS